MSDKQIEYSVFCIENVAERLGKTGTEARNIFVTAMFLTAFFIRFSAEHCINHQ